MGGGGRKGPRPIPNLSEPARNRVNRTHWDSSCLSGHGETANFSANDVMDVLAAMATLP